ncbi:MAG: hypothetical protein DI587_03705 [Variovorax paradoxus]|nr:MAG: hypothetical protein DI583_03705 [Variovorax paradoxus]PZQ15180.1 MAG: hypothetical protein DI587_03705 [Variovorax paradoxus]
MARPTTKRHDVVSATELAEMGLCEMQIVLNHRHGKRTTAEQRESMQRGNVAHAAYLAQGKAAKSDQRCFVATCVFGADADETQLLRVWRDVVLMPQVWGRTLIVLYYCVSPTACKLLARSPAALSVARHLLRIAVAHCDRSLQRRRRS